MPPEHDWWKLAVELEQQGRLTEAEDVIRKALSPRGDPWDCQASYLYELRTRRLIAEGKHEAAREAAQRAVNLMREYASGATSGGEGVALTAQADKVQKRLEELLRQPLERWA